MQLFATPLSHYSRKIRLLLDHYALDYEFVHIGNVVDVQRDTFNGNPLMKVPVLVDDGAWIIESDHIAAQIVRKYDPGDRYRVLITEPETLNMRAVLNGAMSEGVKLILAERTGLDTASHAFFEKARASIKNGLGWLEERAECFDAGEPGYLEFHLVCLWDHLQHYNLVPLLYPQLNTIVTELNKRERITESSPSNSLRKYQPRS